MGLNGQLHDPLFHCGTSAWYALNMILCVPQCQCGCLGEEKNLTPDETGILIPWLFSPQPRCYTADLFWSPELLWAMPLRIDVHDITEVY
jgi:hypothetical protein